MSPSFPPEILDLITDHLHDEPTTLKTCCVVSKSWIHRTRTHLFATVKFCFLTSPTNLKLWKKTFPDPSSSPAHHTRSLFISGLSAFTAAYGDGGGWIRTFHNVVDLHLQSLGSDDYRVSLIQFHGFSPTLRSLRLIFVFREVLDFICSFPLLEDLGFVPFGGGCDAWNTPLTSPKLTGSLELRNSASTRPAIRQLLDLPGGLNFAKITVAYRIENVESIIDLVSECSDTLKSLDIRCRPEGAFPFSLHEWSMPYRCSWM
jgi:hypothetical protein